MSENALKESSFGPRFSDVAGVMPVLDCVSRNNSMRHARRDARRHARRH